MPIATNRGCTQGEGMFGAHAHVHSTLVTHTGACYGQATGGRSVDGMRVIMPELLVGAALADSALVGAASARAAVSDERRF